MKKLLYIICALLSLPVLNGCSEHEIPNYDGKDAIFFDQQYGVAWFDTLRQSHQIYSLVSFGLMIEPDSTIMVKIETTGYLRDYDRPFAIEIVKDSTTAIEGTEFELPERNPVIRAGQNSTYIPVTYHRTERMSNQTVQLQIRLVPGEHFALPFGPDGIGMMPKRFEGGEVFTELSTNSDPAIHNIFANALLKKPKGWNNVQFGGYTQKKFALILEITEAELGWNVVDFNNDENNKMSIYRSPVVAKHVSAYLMEQYRKGREHWVIDEDGSMMYVKGVSWAEGTKPADMKDF